jgi:hypothetical protein
MFHQWNVFVSAAWKTIVAGVHGKVSAYVDIADTAIECFQVFALRKFLLHFQLNIMRADSDWSKRMTISGRNSIPGEQFQHL